MQDVWSLCVFGILNFNNQNGDVFQCGRKTQVELLSHQGKSDVGPPYNFELAELKLKFHLGCDHVRAILDNDKLEYFFDAVLGLGFSFET